MRRYIKKVALVVTMFMVLSGCSYSSSNTTITPTVATSAATTTPAITEEVDAPNVGPTAEVPPTAIPEIVTPTEEASVTEELEATPTEEVVPTEAPIVTEEVLPTATPKLTTTPVPTSTPKPKPTATSKPTPSPTPTPEVVNGIMVGDYVVFGSYPQTTVKKEDLTPEVVNASYDKYGRATINGVLYGRNITTLNVEDPDFFGEDYQYVYGYYEPIEWLVMEIKDGNAFLLSKYVLDAQMFDGNFDRDACFHDTEYSQAYDMNWSLSTLRKWLNKEFYHVAFGAAEKENVLTTKVKMEQNSKSGASSGPDTKDKVFVPSEREMLKYFSPECLLSIQSVQPERTEHLGVLTEYAFERWSGNRVYLDSERWESHYATTILRNSGRDEINVEFVGNSGYLNQEGKFVDIHIGVRPCIWIDLDAADVEKTN